MLSEVFFIQVAYWQFLLFNEDEFYNRSFLKFARLLPLFIVNVTFVEK